MFAAYLKLNIKKLGLVEPSAHDSGSSRGEERGSHRTMEEKTALSSKGTVSLKEGLKNSVPCLFRKKGGVLIKGGV